MGGGMKGVGAGIGIAVGGTILTIVVLVIGLRLGDPFINSINEQGQAVSCFDADDIPRQERKVRHHGRFGCNKDWHGYNSCPFS